MPNRYWVGGSGNLSDDENHWATSSGGSPGIGNLPTSVDDIFIDENSGFSGGGGIIVGDVLGLCHDFNSLTGDNYTISGGNFDISGSFLGESGLILDGVYINFMSSSTETIQSNGMSFFSITVGTDNEGTPYNINLSLLDDISCDSFAVTNGTFDANNNNISSNSFFFYADTGYTPTIIMGNGTWSVVDGNWEMIELNAEVITIIPETSTIRIFADAGNFYGLGKTFNNIWFSGNNISIYNSNTFNDFKIDEGFALLFEGGSTQTINGTPYLTGTVGNLITLDSLDTITPVQFNISKSSGIISCDYLDIRNFNAIGGATWYAGSHSVDTSNNDGWLFEDAPSATNTSDEREAKLLGKNSYFDSRLVKVIGKLSTFNERSSKLIGKDTASSQRSVRVIGMDQASSDRNSLIHGKQWAFSGVFSKIVGKINTFSSKLAKLIGVDFINNSRLAKIKGKDISFSERVAYIHGQKIAGEGVVFNSNNPASSLSDSIPGLISWNNVENVYSENGVCATTPNFNTISVSRYLRAYNFGFNIPVGATILGIKVEIKKASNGTSKKDNLVNLYNGTYVGDNKSDIINVWPTTLAYTIYGGESDMWGTTLTATQVNNPGFGVGISGKNIDSSACNCQVDHFRMTVYYEAEGSVRSAKAIGQIISYSEKIAHLVGSSAFNSEKSAKIVGKDIISDYRQVKITGINFTTSEQSAKIIGKDTVFDNRDAKIVGMIVVDSERGSKITGKLFANNERSADIKGKVGTSSERGVGITGMDQVSSERSGAVRGQAGAFSEVLAMIRGKQSIFDSRLANIIGKIFIFIDRSAKIHGKDTSQSDRSVRIHGKKIIFGERSARLIGKVVLPTKKINLNQSSGRIILNIRQRRSAILK